MSQPELIPRPVHRTLMEAVEDRLPKRDFLSVSDIAAAVGISPKTVYEWLDEGLLPHVNWGSRRRPYYQIYRSDFLRFARERVMEP